MGATAIAATRSVLPITSLAQPQYLVSSKWQRQPAASYCKTRGAFTHLRCITPKSRRGWLWFVAVSVCFDLDLCVLFLMHTFDEQSYFSADAPWWLAVQDFAGTHIGYLNRQDWEGLPIALKPLLRHLCTELPDIIQYEKQAATRAFNNRGLDFANMKRDANHGVVVIPSSFDNIARL
eukprot:SAG31_NODE_5448_length_2529_cov_2.282367_1_plen_178_part_00